MKLSELISILQKFQQENGDLPVFWDREDSHPDDDFEIIVRTNDKPDPFAVPGFVEGLPIGNYALMR